MFSLDHVMYGPVKHPAAPPPVKCLEYFPPPFAGHSYTTRSLSHQFTGAAPPPVACTAPASVHISTPSSPLSHVKHALTFHSLHLAGYMPLYALMLAVVDEVVCPRREMGSCAASISAAPVLSAATSASVYNTSAKRDGMSDFARSQEYGAVPFLYRVCECLSRYKGDLHGCA